jgi:hypothetical protein
MPLDHADGLKGNVVGGKLEVLSGEEPIVDFTKREG